MFNFLKKLTIPSFDRDPVIEEEMDDIEKMLDKYEPLESHKNPRANMFTSGIYDGLSGGIWIVPFHELGMTDQQMIEEIILRAARDLEFFTGNGAEKNEGIFKFCEENAADVLQKCRTSENYQEYNTLNDVCRVLANRSKWAGVHSS